VNRNWLNLIVDGLAALTALALVWTGLLIWFVLPPRAGSPAWLGLDRHAWGEVHFGIAMALIALALVHVALHWTWVCTMLCRLAGRERRAWSAARRRIVGTLVLLVLVALFVGSLAWVSRHVADEPERRGPMPRWRALAQPDGERRATDGGL